MLSRKLVKDVVVPINDYPHVGEDQTLQDAIDKMLAYTGPSSGHLQMHELAVFDDSNNLSGTLSFKQVLVALEPNLCMITM